MPASRKLYKAVAEAILDMSVGAPPSRFDMADALAAIFKADNERFQYARFMEACGFPSPVGGQ